MGKLLKWNLLSCLFLCLGVGLLLSVPAGAVDVSDPVLDTTTKGDWRGTYGDCYVQLPDAGCTGFPEPEFGTEFGGVCTSDPLPVVNDTFDIYRGDGRPANTFWNTVNDCSGGDGPIEGGLCGTVEEQFNSCGADFSMCPGSAQWNPCADAFKGSLWDEGDCFTPGGVVPPLKAEITIDFEGSTQLAYYFSAGCGSSRTQNWWLYVDNVLEKSGVITVTGDGQYLVFELANVVSGTVIRFETQNQLPTQCDPDPPPPGGPPNNTVLSGVFLSNCVSEPVCSIGDYVWEDVGQNGDPPNGCQDPDERPIEGVDVKLFEVANCGEQGETPTQISTDTTDENGFYEFTGLDCSKEYRVQFGDAGAIYKRTLPNQECSDTDPPEPSDARDSDCAQDDGFSGCVSFPDPVGAPNNPTIDCGYVCDGKIGDYVWFDENDDGCQDEVNTGIAGVDVTLSEDCDVQANPQTVQTDADGFYLFEGLCPGEYFVEFGNGRPNTDPGQVCDPDDPDVSQEKDSNCGDEALQCVTLDKDNPEDPTIDCGKVGPCIELEKLVSGDGGVNFFDADNCSDADVPFTADDAEYKLIVTNCGKEAVTLDRIVDNDLGIFLTLDPTVTIQPNDSVEFTNDAGQTEGLLQKVGACPNPDSEFDNTATVFGMGDGSNLPVEATDPACVKCGPCIEILKDVRDAENQSGDYQPADSCDDTVPINNGAEYRLTVTNCGAEDLRDVKINDLKLSITDFPVGDLAAGDTKVFFFDSPDGGIPELQQPNLCEDISPEVEFLNVSSVEGTGVDSNLTVTDENPACVECQPECDIQVTKTCEILSPEPPLLGKCSGKLQEVVVIWNGTDSIDLTPGNGVTSLSANQVDPGDELTIFTDGSTNDVFVNISDSVNGESKFHISCSDRDMNADNDNGDQQQLPDQSQDCGKFQGNAKSTSGFINTWLLEGMLDADGLRLDCTPQETFPTETEECDYTPQPEGGNCDDIKDITGLTLVWDGADGVNIETELGQVINNIQKGDVIFLDTPKDQTGNDVDVFLSGTVEGISRFHISCSDDDMDGPEDCGTAQGNGKGDDASLINQWLFGGMTGEKGSFGCPGVPGGSDSAEVVYGIRVENPNNEPVEARIVDDELGIDETVTIDANDTYEMVTEPKTIMPDATNEFTNTVVVTAKTESGATCEASDSVTVKRNPPPPEPPLLGKCSGKLQEVVVFWNGTGSIDLVPGAGVTSLSATSVNPGEVLTIFTDGSTNDVFVGISGSVSGESKFHISCSDRDMNADDDDQDQQQLPGESQDCGKFQGNAKSTSGFINSWLLEGMLDANGLRLVCDFDPTTVTPQSGGNPGGSSDYVTAAASLDLGDNKKVKWELKNNGNEDVYVEKVSVTWPDAAEEHDQLKKFKLAGDFAKDVFDDESETTVPDEKAFESDPNKRKLKKGETKKLEIEFTKEFDDKSQRGQDDFTIQVEFNTGQVLNFP